MKILLPMIRYYIAAGTSYRCGLSWSIENVRLYTLVKFIIPHKNCRLFVVGLFYVSVWFLWRVAKLWSAHARHADLNWNEIGRLVAWITGSRRNRTNLNDVRWFLKPYIRLQDCQSRSIGRNQEFYWRSLTNCSNDDNEDYQNSRERCRRHQLPTAGPAADVIPSMIKPLLPMIDKEIQHTSKRINEVSLISDWMLE